MTEELAPFASRPALGDQVNHRVFGRGVVVVAGPAIRVRYRGATRMHAPEELAYQGAEGFGVVLRWACGADA